MRPSENGRLAIITKSLNYAAFYSGMFRGNLTVFSVTSHLPCLTMILHRVEAKVIDKRKATGYCR